MRHRHGHDGYGNPKDLTAYLERMEDPGRGRWQKPDRVVRALGLRRGATVCEVGAGSGYFTRRLARAVGPRGRVFAVEPDPRILPILRDRLVRARLSNVTPVLGLDRDPLVPDRSCDRILLVDAFHHLPDGLAYLRLLRRKLSRGGCIANIDFEKVETPIGPPVEHRIARDVFLRTARAAGLRLLREETFLPYQYFLVLGPR